MRVFCKPMPAHNWKTCPNNPCNCQNEHEQYLLDAEKAKNPDYLAVIAKIHELVRTTPELSSSRTLNEVLDEIACLCNETLKGVKS